MYTTFQELYDDMASYLMTKAIYRYTPRHCNAYESQDIFQMLTAGLYCQWLHHPDNIHAAQSKYWLFLIARTGATASLARFIRRDNHASDQHAPADDDAYDYMLESIAEPQEWGHYHQDRNLGHSHESRETDFLIDVREALRITLHEIKSIYPDISDQALEDMLAKLRGDNPEYSRVYFRKTYNISRPKFDIVYHILRERLKVHLQDYAYAGIFPKINDKPRQITNGEEWTQEEIDKMLEMSQEGKSNANIGNVLGRSRHAVCTKLRNIRLKSDNRQELAEHIAKQDAIKCQRKTKLETALELRKAGKSWDAIAYECGAKSGSSIRQLVRRNGHYAI